MCYQPIGAGEIANSPALCGSRHFMCLECNVKSVVTDIERQSMCLERQLVWPRCPMCRQTMSTLDNFYVVVIKSLYGGYVVRLSGYSVEVTRCERVIYQSCKSDDTSWYQALFRVEGILASTPTRLRVERYGKRVLETACDLPANASSYIGFCLSDALLWKADKSKIEAAVDSLQSLCFPERVKTMKFMTDQTYIICARQLMEQVRLLGNDDIL